MGQPLIEKIFLAHSRDEVAPGNIVWLDLDVRAARDFGGANVVGHLQREYADAPLGDTAQTFFTFDCVVPASTIPYANNQHICRTFAERTGARLYDVDAGIGTHVLFEQGHVLPGSTVVSTDSHANIMGAFGAFGQGMGDADIAFAMKAGRTWFEVPPTMKIEVRGALRPPLTAKDLTLHIVGTLGAAGALGRAVEIEGPAIDELDLAGRITLCSMATEMGAVAVILPPNDAVLDELRQRSGRADVEAVRPDADADYVETVTVDIDGLSPLVARPGRPDDVAPVASLGDVPVHSVFLGSCTNGRIEDFRTALAVMGGRKVAPGVMAKVVPATREVYGQMLAEGLVAQFFEAGVIVSNPGCGGCAQGQVGMTGRGEVQVSTSNRNFPGKQGAGDTYLAGPAVAAASAVAGRLVAP